MARCYQCGTQTYTYLGGSPLCDDCEGKLPPRPKPLTLQQSNEQLNRAREQYRAAIAKRAVLGSKQSLDGDITRNIAAQKADDQVELAAMRFREALRDFVVALKRERA
jgi:hypothetical protein